MTLVYAHRGASAEFPENTMPAFQRAVDLGVDILETDAHVTIDSKVVLAHDEHGKRLAKDPRFIRDCTLADVQKWGIGIPTLHEVLTAFPKMRFNIDCKAPDFAAVDRILEVIRDADAEERCQISSFHSRNLRRVRERGWKSPTGLGQSEAIKLTFLPTKLVRRTGDIAQVPVRMGPIRFDTRKFIDKAHRLGLRVDYWVVNDAQLARRLVDLGADGIMTDDPAKILPAVRR
jgi:glycerophosphoryl diester phosphodiesterase